MGHGLVSFSKQDARRGSAALLSFNTCFRQSRLRFNFRRRDSENGIELSNLENFHIGWVDVAEEERYLLFVGLLLEGDERATRTRT